MVPVVITRRVDALVGNEPPHSIVCLSACSSGCETSIRATFPDAPLPDHPVWTDTFEAHVPPCDLTRSFCQRCMNSPFRTR